MKKGLFQKKDILLAMAVIVTAGIFMLGFRLSGRRAGDRLRVTIDGIVYGDYLLSENQAVTFDEELGYNQIVIQDGYASMSEADCPDQYCVAHKPVSMANETIVCLPHKLVAAVVGQQNGHIPAPDAVSQ